MKMAVSAELYGVHPRRLTIGYANGDRDAIIYVKCRVSADTLNGSKQRKTDTNE